VTVRDEDLRRAWAEFFKHDIVEMLS
jgi:hypothetical protein